MTGFGIGEAPLGAGIGGRLSVEIRGVNHRFLDVRVRVPRDLADVATFVEQVAREKLARGRFEIGVRVDGATLGAPVLDRDRAKAAYAALCSLRDEIAPGAEVPLSLLASLPDVFVSSVDREIDRIRDGIRRAFDVATKALDEMRSNEGAALATDLAKRLDTVRRLAREISTRSPEVVEIHRNRLRERAHKLRAHTEIDVDSGRLEQEIALFAERVDICEELTRLDSHCDQFTLLVAGHEACGRRLDFLLQEMAREANTVGAKSPDAQITHAIVELKAEIERMREQVQNVE
jgi:uncharacterized protein (TIGR00255 family)